MAKNKSAIVLIGSGSRQNESKKKNTELSVHASGENVSKKRKLSNVTVKTQPFVSRMSPSGLYKFVNDALSPEQLRAIHSIGFGGLLELQTDVLPKNLPSWLVSTFDVCKCALMNGELTIDDIDVHLATGLPMGEVDINQASTACREKIFEAEKARWLLQFGTGKKVLKKTLYEKMLSQVDGGDEFKRNFIVYVVSTFLMGVKGDVASARILKCLLDISVVPSMNWCSFTRRHLVDSIAAWKKDTNPKKVYKGPIMVLLFIYLDRVVHRFRDVKRAFPTMSTWTRKAITERIASETKDGFGKGRVEVRLVPVLEAAREVERKQVEPELIDQGDEDQDCDGKDNVGDDNVVTMLGKATADFARSYSCLKYALREARLVEPSDPFVLQIGSFVEHVSEGYKEHCKSGDADHPNAEFGISDSQLNKLTGELDRSFCTLEETPAEPVVLSPRPTPNEPDAPTVVMSDPPVVFESVSLIREPDEADVIMNDTHAVEAVIPSLETVVGDVVMKDASGALRASPRTEADETSDILHNSDDIYVAAAIEAERVYASRLAQAPVQPVQTETKKKKKKKKEIYPDVPSFDILGSEFDSTQETDSESQHATGIDPELDGVINRIQSTTFVPPPKSTSILADVSTDVPAVPFDKTNVTSDVSIAVLALPSPQAKVNSEVPIDVLALPSPQANLHSDVPQAVVSLPQSDSERDYVRQSKRQRVGPITDVYRSPFMQRNVDLVNPMSKMEKLVADLALVEGRGLDSEILYECGHHKLSRLDMKSLVGGGRVALSLLRVWCDILNKGEDLKSNDSPLRLFCYFDTSNSVEHLKIDFNKVKLVFIPMLSKSAPFILFCANFLASKFEIIHAMTPKTVPYETVVKKYKDGMIKQLKDKMQAAHNSISFLDVHEFVPKEHIVGSDSGIHVMYFMDTYVGKKTGYTCSLANPKKMKMFSVKVCHRILTSDLNILKDKVLKDAELLRTGPGLTGNLRLPSPTPKYDAPYLVEYVRATKTDASEVVIDTKWIEVTLHGVRSLRPRAKISSMVIDVVGIRHCLSNPDFLFLPTVVKDVVAEDRSTLYTQYVDMSYIPIDGKKVKKVFFPLFEDNHWYAVVADLKEKKLFVLNSLNPSNYSATNEFVLEVTFNVEQAIDKKNGYESLNGMAMWDIVHVSVPQQVNTFDCGVHLLKWIEAGNNDTLWTYPKYYTNLHTYRESKIVELLTWEENRIKSFEILRKKPVQRQSSPVRRGGTPDCVIVNP